MQHKNYFFLGGYDLEMITIRDLLLKHCTSEQIFDKKLSWGARRSDYKDEILEIREKFGHPVFIELQNDFPLDNCTDIDHHGERSGKDSPTSLEQIFSFLHLSSENWTRWFALVSANDKAYIPGLKEIGSSPEEIVLIRSKDREAQGITDREEAEAEISIRNRETFLNGKLTQISIPHRKTSSVTDRLEPALGGPGYENLIILSPDQLSFFGSGRLVYLLHEKFGGWYGGNLEPSSKTGRGYWGKTGNEDIINWLIIEVSKESAL